MDGFTFSAQNRSCWGLINASANFDGLKGEISGRVGTDNWGVGLGAKGSIYSVNTNSKIGLSLGQDHEYGLFGNLEAGAYVAQGEVEGNLDLGIIKFKKILVGGSFASAHIGLNSGVYVDDIKKELNINLMAHGGLGLGLKGGIQVAIPLIFY